MPVANTRLSSTQDTSTNVALHSYGVQHNVTTTDDFDDTPIPPPIPLYVAQEVQTKKRPLLDVGLNTNDDQTKRPRIEHQPQAPPQSPSISFDQALNHNNADETQPLAFDTQLSNVTTNPQSHTNLVSSAVSQLQPQPPQQHQNNISEILPSKLLSPDFFENNKKQNRFGLVQECIPKNGNFNLKKCS